MANDIFLKKVYDKYLKTDFTYGDADLNPKREISLETTVTGKELSEKIEEKILARFYELQEKANDILKYQASVPLELKAEENVEIGNLSGKLNGKDLSGEEAIKEQVGGHLPGLDLDKGNPLVKEIDKLIRDLIPYLDPTNTEDPTDPNSPNLSLTEFDVPFANIINCHTSYEDFTDVNKKKESELNNGDTELDSNNIDPSKCKNIKCPNSHRVFTPEERLYISHHNGYCKTCYENPKLKHCEKCGAIIPEGKNTCEVCGKDKEDKEKKSNDEAQAKIKEEIPCIVRELSILKMFAISLKIINTGVKGVSTVLMVAVPIIKVVSRCAGCWVCPPSAGEAVQLIMEQVTSLIIDVLGTMLQMIWDMLQLDCLDKIGLSLKSQIMNTLAGLQQIEHAGTPILLAKEELVKEWGAMKSNVSKTVKITRDALGDFTDLDAMKGEIKSMKKRLRDMPPGKDRDTLVSELAAKETELNAKKEELDDKALKEKEERKQNENGLIGDAFDKSVSRLSSAGDKALKDLKRIGNDFIIEIN